VPPLPASFIPARTLFVAQSWPANADPAVYHTTGANALAAAAALVPPPVDANPALIVWYPGAYPGPLVLVSSVHHTAPRRAVVWSGAVTWNAGAGPNLPQAGALEWIGLHGVTITAALTVDTTAKTGGHAVFEPRDIGAGGGITFTGRAVDPDHFQSWSSVLFSALSFTNCNLNLFDGSYGDLSVSGGACDISGNEIFTLGGPGLVLGAGGLPTTGRVSGCEINAAVTVLSAGTSIDFYGSRLKGGSICTVGAGAAADWRMGEYDTAAQLAGGGTVDRTVFELAIGPTGPANIVGLGPPYPSGVYTVTATQTSPPAPGEGPPAIVGKGAGGFTLLDGTPGRTFDLLVTRA
jgi:hypothetical protein